MTWTLVAVMNQLGNVVRENLKFTLIFSHEWISDCCDEETSWVPPVLLELTEM